MKTYKYCLIIFMTFIDLWDVCVPGPLVFYINFINFIFIIAAKIAAVSGDMRRALDIGRRVIELAKRSNFSNNQSLDNMIKDKTVTVELKEVLQVLNDVYGGSRKIDDEVDEGFPMQQKLILCSLMLMLTKGNNKDIVMGKLFDVYKK